MQDFNKEKSLRTKLQRKLSGYLVPFIKRTKQNPLGSLNLNSNDSSHLKVNKS